MKKNLILLSILSALLVFTYFWEELGHKKTIIAQTEQGIISELFEIKEVKVNSKTVSNQEVLKVLKDKIKKIKVIKEVASENTKQFFVDNKIHITIIGDVEFNFIIGDFIYSQSSMYLQDRGSQKVYIVKDSSIIEGIYRDEKKAEHRKYLNLIELFLSAK